MQPTDTPLRRLLAQPMFRRWAVTNLFARLPLTMNLLVLVLVGEQVTGSLATGATFAGTATFTAGIAAQWRGRRLDRVELNHGLTQDLVASGLSIAAIAVATVLRAPVPVFLVLAVVQGVSFAAVLGGFRALLVHAVPPEDLTAANAMDAVFVEVAFVAGPAAAGVLSLVLSPAGVLALMVAASAIAAVLMRGLPRRAPVVARGVRPAGRSPLRIRGASPIYAIALGAGTCLGAFEALIPARLEQGFGQSPESAGPFLALTALGSGIAGVVAANAGDQLRRARFLAAALLVAIGIALVPAALAGSLAILGIALFLVGLPIAPLNALASLGLQRIIPLHRQAEGFALYPAMILIGAGIGQTGVGSLLQVASPGTVLLAVAAIPTVLALTVLGAAIRRRAMNLPPGVGADHDPTIADPTAPIPG